MNKTTAPTLLTTLTTTTVNAPDISCGGCANAIKKALGSVDGVSGVDVDVVSKGVTVTYDERATGQSAIEAALERAGFPVSASG